MRRRHTALAVILAFGAHLLALLALGWRTPKAPAPPAADAAPPIELSVVRIKPESAASPAAGAPKPTRAPASPSTAPTTASSAPAVPALPAPSAPPSSAVASGSPDCEPEDLPLLNDAERAACRNQIDVDRGRRLARAADGRIAKEVARAMSAPRIDSIPAEKRAYYDAVAAAYDQQSHGPPMAGRLPGPVCGGKPPHSLKIGPLPCYIAPPQGFLTEESGLDPLAPQWLPKK